jgi:hypothetical protein
VTSRSPSTLTRRRRKARNKETVHQLKPVLPSPPDPRGGRHITPYWIPMMRTSSPAPCCSPTSPFLKLSPLSARPRSLLVLVLVRPRSLLVLVVARLLKLVIVEVNNPRRCCGGGDEGGNAGY